jgi:hypothetical protein
MKKYVASFFGGVVSKKEDATLEVHEDRIVVSTQTSMSIYYSNEYRCESPAGKIPLRIEVKSGEMIEVETSQLDRADLNKLLKKTSKYLYWIEKNTLTVTVSTVSIIFLIYAFIQYGAPFFSEKVAMMLPSSILLDADEMILKQLDGTGLSESKLSEKERLEITEYLQGHSDEQVSIEFRKGNRIGANAFALAGNKMIFTDELITSLKNKKLLLPIFFHELGHLKKRHLAATLTSTISVNVFSMMIIGDMTGISESFSNIAFSLTSLKLSRVYEFDADRYSFQKLVDHGMEPSCFKNSFEVIVNEQKKISGVKFQSESDEESSVLELFSTHPNMKARFEVIDKDFPDSKACNL